MVRKYCLLTIIQYEVLNFIICMHKKKTNSIYHTLYFSLPVVDA